MRRKVRILYLNYTNRIMKRFILSSIGAVLALSGQAQITIDGAAVVVQPGAVVFSEAYLTNEVGGTIDNSGEIYVGGDWTNNGGNTALINDSPGDVILNGPNQIIGGFDLTRFYTLVLDGNYGRKDLQVNSEVTNRLNLTNDQLETWGNNMRLSNPLPSSLAFNDGYISSEYQGGYFSRITAFDSSYWFPMGSQNITGSGVYRPVKLTPADTLPNEYAVRLAGLDASNDFGISMSGYNGAYDLSVATELIDNPNRNYYHNIYRWSGSTPVDIRMYYEDGDGDYVTMAQWQDSTTSWQTNSPSWEDMTFTISNMPDADATSKFTNINMYAEKTSVMDFMHDGFVLTNIKDMVLIPQLITPADENGLNDFWDIENIEYFPENKIQIYNRYGNMVYQMDGYDNVNNVFTGKANVSKGINMVMGSDFLPSGTYFYVIDLGVPGVDPYVGDITIRL